MHSSRILKIGYLRGRNERYEWNMDAMGVYDCLVFSMKALMHGQNMCMFNMVGDIN